MCSARVSARGLKNEVYTCVADKYTELVPATSPEKLSPRTCTCQPSYFLPI